MASPGVVAVGETEHRQPGFALAGEAGRALEGLAFERGVEGLGGFVGRGSDRSHGLDHTRLLAGPLEGFRRVLRSVAGADDRPGQAAGGQDDDGGSRTRIRRSAGR